MLEYEQLTSVFSKIIENPDDAKQALDDPSAIFTKYGITVPDAEATNKILFETVPQLRAHFLAAARSKPHANALLGCESPGCIACKSGLTIALAGIIPIAMAGGAAAFGAIGAIAGIVGASTEVIMEIIHASSSGPSGIINSLCRVMGAC